MIHWALFSTLATGVFYGAYLLIFRNDRQLQLRRWYLLAALAFSLAYPLVRLPQAVAAPTVVSTLPEVVVGGAKCIGGSVDEPLMASVGTLYWRRGGDAGDVGRADADSNQVFASRAGDAARRQYGAILVLWAYNHRHARDDRRRAADGARPRGGACAQAPYD